MNFGDFDVWGGTNAAADTFRLVIVFIGITLGLICFRFAYLTKRRGQGYRAPGLIGVGLVIMTPALTGLYRFEEPDILLLPAITYLLGLGLCLLALRTNYTLTPPEWRLGGRDQSKDVERNRDAGV